MMERINLKYIINIYGKVTMKSLCITNISNKNIK
jgi:hypothetical protein